MLDWNQSLYYSSSSIISKCQTTKTTIARFSYNLLNIILFVLFGSYPSWNWNSCHTLTSRFCLQALLLKTCPVFCSLYHYNYKTVLHYELRVLCYVPCMSIVVRIEEGIGYGIMGNSDFTMVDELTHELCVMLWHWLQNEDHEVRILDLHLVVCCLVISSLDMVIVLYPSFSCLVLVSIKLDLKTQFLSYRI